MTGIVLASASPTRVALLTATGLGFTTKTAPIDERAVDGPLLAKGADPATIATALADAKIVAVSREEAGTIVIGADQTLELEGKRFTKPATIAEARDQLTQLCGRTHELHTAVAAGRDGAIVWRYRDTANLTMRRLTDVAIDRYLVRVGPAALLSVGAYQIEAPGIQLFDKIDGDYFTILGLPILPLLAFLRGEGAIT